MADRVSIVTSDGASFDVSLEHRQMSLGRQLGCDVRIDHDEVAGVAAKIDYRGGCYMLQNCNPYQVYVGASAVSSDQWAEWPNGQQLLLTRSVSLTLHCGNGSARTTTKADADSADGELAEEKPDGKKIIQLVVIAACAVFGVMMMAIGPSSEPQQPTDGFATLISELDAKSKLTQDNEIVRRYLQEAHLMDIRYRRGDPKPIIRAYELLINHPSICHTDFDEPTIEARIRRYAEQRLETLGTKK